MKWSTSRAVCCPYAHSTLTLHSRSIIHNVEKIADRLPRPYPQPIVQNAKKIADRKAKKPPADPPKPPEATVPSEKVGQLRKDLLDALQLAEAKLWEAKAVFAMQSASEGDLLKVELLNDLGERPCEELHPNLKLLEEAINESNKVTPSRPPAANLFTPQVEHPPLPPSIPQVEQPPPLPPRLAIISLRHKGEGAKCWLQATGGRGVGYSDPLTLPPSHPPTFLLLKAGVEAELSVILTLTPTVTRRAWRRS